MIAMTTGGVMPPQTSTNVNAIQWNPTVGVVLKLMIKIMWPWVFYGCVNNGLGRGGLEHLVETAARRRFF